MKYLIGLILVLILVRIDFILKSFDNLSERFNRSSSPVLSTEEPQRSAPVAMVDDKAMQSPPRTSFLIMLERFADTPRESFRRSAFEIFQSDPQMFGKKLDQDLAGAIYSWRDLIVQEEPQLPLFLIDLLNLLEGENRSMVQRFYSLLLDANPEWFFATYALAKDQECEIVDELGDSLPAEEKLNMFYDRERSIKRFSESEKIDPAQKLLAEQCLLRLRNYLSTLRAPEASQ